MAGQRLDVVGIGNAIVDIIAAESDDFVARFGMAKGAMTLIDEARAEALYGAVSNRLETSGGSAGNTVAGVASLGGKAGFIGKLRDDELGRIFARDLTGLGVVYRTVPAAEGPATARCIILVTPDAQRTMNTFLGASVGLEPEDIDQGLIADAEITYLEGYLFDPPRAKEAFYAASRLAHEAGRRVALSLSDAFCVVRHRADFLDLVRHHTDLLFANETEITTLFETDFDGAVAATRGVCRLAAITRGAQGSVVVTPEATIEVPAAPVAQVVDTTGAGDLYAAGFLYGLTQGRDLSECGRLASLAAAEIISHYGARPLTSLAAYIAAAG